MARGTMAPYRDAGFFVMRTPLLPYRSFFALSDGVRVKGSDPGPQLDDELARERDRITRNLARALEPDAVREALLVASPSLYQAMLQWERGELDADAERKVVHALHRYVGRMSTRSTPFGLFAGSSIGRLAERTQLRLGPQAANQRFTTLDNSYVFLLLQRIGADPEYRAAATYYPNSGLYRVAGKLRYAETAIDPSSVSMSYQLASLERDEPLALALALAAGGATVSTLSERLASALAVAHEEAAAFVHQLIDAQILVSDLSVAVTGSEPLVDACTQLAVHPRPALVDALRATNARLRALDRRGVGVPPDAYEGVVTELRRLPVDDLEPSRLFHVDLWKPLEAPALGREVVAELRAAIECLHRVAAPPPRTELDDLAEAFRARYGEESVPLGVALDPELGIAAGQATIASESTAILEDLSFHEPDPDDRPESGPLADREQYLLQTLHSLWSRAAHEWVLDEGDVQALQVARTPPLPDSFAAWFQLARRAGERGEAGDHEILLSSVIGPPAGRLLGRFAHASPELTALVRELAQQEARLEPDAVLAEIAHLPEGRTGNVVCRPVLRDFEIPYLGKSGAPRDRQIPIDDLWLSLEDGRFVLWSRRLGRRIVPRLTCAHNITHNTVPLYRFLARLQSQDCTSWLSWTWGRFMHAPHLPRVRLGSVIVSRETWTLHERELEPLRQPSAHARHRAMIALRERRGLPRFVALADGDNELAVDLENTVSVDNLVDLVKARPRARLLELWPGPDHAGVSGQEGAHANEIIVPFVRHADAPQVRPAERRGTLETRHLGSGPRSFAPGSEWLVLRLVTSKSTADELLTHALADEIDALVRSGACDQWSFTPAQGEPWALQLHVHGEPARLEGIVLPRLGRALRASMTDGPLRAWSVETWVPPTARYGGPLALEPVQALGFRDSEAALALIAELLPTGADDRRWQLALMSVDRLLDDLGFELEARCERVGELRASLLRALPVGDAIEGQLSRTFRTHRGRVEALLHLAAREGLAEDAQPVFAQRSRRVQPAVAELHRLRDGGYLTRPWPEVAAELVRAAAHRLLRGAASAHELVIYDFLHRAYRSRIGRAKARRRTSRPPLAKELSR